VGQGWSRKREIKASEWRSSLDKLNKLKTKQNKTKNPKQSQKREGQRKTPERYERGETSFA
jgi:hypothetical protein